MTRAIVAAFALASCASLASAAGYKASLSVKAKAASHAMTADNAFETAMGDSAKLSTFQGALTTAAAAVHTAASGYTYSAETFTYASNVATVPYKYEIDTAPASGAVAATNTEYDNVVNGIADATKKDALKAAIVTACDATDGVANCMIVSDPAAVKTDAAASVKGSVVVTTTLSSQSAAADNKLATAWADETRRNAIITMIKTKVVAALGADYSDATAEVTYAAADVSGNDVTINSKILSAAKSTDAAATTAATAIKAKLEAAATKTAIQDACNTDSQVANTMIGTAAGDYAVTKNANVKVGGSGDASNAVAVAAGALAAAAAIMA